MKTKTNRNKHKIKPPSQAEMGLQGPGGKGDAPRNCFSDDFKENFAGIAGMGTADGFKAVKGGKQIKRYGKPPATRVLPPASWGPMVPPFSGEICLDWKGGSKYDSNN